MTRKRNHAVLLVWGNGSVSVIIFQCGGKNTSYWEGKSYSKPESICHGYRLPYLF